MKNMACKRMHACLLALLDGGYHDCVNLYHRMISSSICHRLTRRFVLFCTFRTYHTASVSHTHVITSRAWGTLGLGILLALILGLIARVPQSDIVLIAAVRCIGIRSSSTKAARLLLLRVRIWILVLVLVVIKWLLILLLRLREGWAVVVLVLVI